MYIIKNRYDAPYEMKSLYEVFTNIRKIEGYVSIEKNGDILWDYDGIIRMLYMLNM